MNIINVGGNAILIYGFHRGTEGVAIPTLVSRMVAAVIIIALLCNPNQLLHIERTFRYKFNWQMVKKILSIGVPNGLENSMFQLGKILVLSLVSTFGTYAIAANAVGNAIALFQILPGMAISLAVTTVIARCVGAGDYEQVKYYNRKLMAITYVCMAATVFFIFSILPLIIKAYNLSDVTAQGNGADHPFPWNQRNPDLAHILYAAGYLPCVGRCQGMHVHIHTVHVDLQNRIQLRAG